MRMRQQRCDPGVGGDLIQYSVHLGETVRSQRVAPEQQRYRYDDICGATEHRLNFAVGRGDPAAVGQKHAVISLRGEPGEPSSQPYSNC